MDNGKITWKTAKRKLTELIPRQKTCLICKEQFIPRKDCDLKSNTYGGRAVKNYLCQN